MTCYIMSVSEKLSGSAGRLVLLSVASFCRSNLTSCNRDTSLLSVTYFSLSNDTKRREQIRYWFKRTIYTKKQKLSYGKIQQLFSLLKYLSKIIYVHRTNYNIQLSIGKLLNKLENSLRPETKCYIRISSAIIVKLDENCWL